MILRTGNKRQNVEQLRARARGFTLIEFVLVMSMLMVVMSVAMPSLSNFFSGRSLEAEARRFLHLTRYGASRAVAEGVPVRLWVDVKTGRYGLQAEASYEPKDQRKVEFQVDDELQLEIPAASASSSKNTTGFPAIRFLPNGFVSAESIESVSLRQVRGDGTEETVLVSKSWKQRDYEIREDSSF